MENWGKYHLRKQILRGRAGCETREELLSGSIKDMLNRRHQCDFQVKLAFESWKRHMS